MLQKLRTFFACVAVLLDFQRGTTCAVQRCVPTMSLEARVDRIEAKLTSIDVGLDRLEKRVDEGFASVDDFRQSTLKFQQSTLEFQQSTREFQRSTLDFQASVDKRFDELHTHIRMIDEHFDSKFALLYEGVKAHFNKQGR